LHAPYKYSGLTPESSGLTLECSNLNILSDAIVTWRVQVD